MFENFNCLYVLFDLKKINKNVIFLQLGFNVRGGREHNCGIYVSKVCFLLELSTRREKHRGHFFKNNCVPSRV